MGLAWQQGPLATGTIGHFLVPDPLPERLLFAEPLRRRMRVRFGGALDRRQRGRRAPARTRPLSRSPTSRSPTSSPTRSSRSTGRPPTAISGATSWFSVRAGGETATRAAWQHVGLPPHATDLDGRVAFAWRAMDGLLRGGRADRRPRRGRVPPQRHPPHLPASRRPRGRPGRRGQHRAAGALRVRVRPPLVCPACGRRRVGPGPGAGPDVLPVQGAGRLLRRRPVRARRRGPTPRPGPRWPRCSGLVSFEPDKVEVTLDGTVLRQEPGQQVTPHGVDRGLTEDEVGVR